MLSALAPGRRYVGRGLTHLAFNISFEFSCLMAVGSCAQLFFVGGIVTWGFAVVGLFL